MQHVRADCLHDLDPAAGAGEGVGALCGAGRVAFELGEGLQHEDLEVVLGAEGADLVAGADEVRVGGGGDGLGEVGGGEVDEIGEAEFYGLEAWLVVRMG